MFLLKLPCSIAKLDYIPPPNGPALARNSSGTAALPWPLTLSRADTSKWTRSQTRAPGVSRLPRPCWASRCVSSYSKMVFPKIHEKTKSFWFSFCRDQLFATVGGTSTVTCLTTRSSTPWWSTLARRWWDKPMRRGRCVDAGRMGELRVAPVKRGIDGAEW